MSASTKKESSENDGHVVTVRADDEDDSAQGHHRRRRTDKDAPSLSSLFVVFLAVGIDMLGVCIILPTLPQLAIEFGVGSMELGLIFAVYGAAQMISMPIFGKISDRIGRRPVVMMSLTGSMIGFFFQGFAKSYGWFMVARAVAGLFGSTIPVAQAYVADVTTQKERPKYLAGLSSVIAASFMFGPGVGAGLAQFSLSTPMFVSSGLAAMGLAMAVLYLEETNFMAAKAQSKSEEPEKDDVSAAVAASHRPLIYLMWVVSFLNMFAFSAHLGMFGLLILELFGWESLQLGFIGMGSGLVTIVSQLVLYNRLRENFGKHGSLIIAIITLSGGLLLIPVFEAKAPVLVGVGLVSIGYGIASPSIVAILSRYATAAQQGSVLGAGMAFSAFARVVGPVTMGILYEESRRLPFFVASGVLVLNATIVFIVLRLNRQLPEHRKERALEMKSMRLSVFDSRVRLGSLTADGESSDRSVSFFDFLLRLLRKRGYVEADRDLSLQHANDVEEMATLLHRAVVPIGLLDRIGEDIEETLCAYTRNPVH